MKIPFDIKCRDKIESGEYKVETRDGCSARIVCWDRAPKENNPKDLNLCVLVEHNGGESIYYYHTDGTKWVKEKCFDLFLVTPEPEMTEFEKAIDAIYESCNVKQLRVKDKATELLALAKQQLLQSGELLTQEHHEKLMETQYKETLDGVKKNWHDYFTPQAVTDIYNAGRNDVLKDLPRWSKGSIEGDRIVGLSLYHDSKWIPFFDLEKLPGFKEDESHE